MARYILYLIFSSVIFLCNSQSLTQKAANAYSADRYGEAIETYNQIIKEQGVSSDLYYNLGNAYYKSGMLGKSVLCFERSLLLNPGNKDAQANLDFVNSKIADKFSTDENIIDSFMDSVMSFTNANGWAMIAISSFIVLLLFAALYIFSANIWLRKVGFFGGMALLVVCVFTNIIAFNRARTVKDSGYAVVMSHETVLSTAPREPKSKTEEAFLLHEGAKVMLLDSVEVKTDSIVNKWYDVVADETHRAWIKGADIEKI